MRLLFVAFEGNPRMPHRVLVPTSHRPHPTPPTHRYGVGIQLDFLAPSPGAILILHNSAVLRHLCVDIIDEPSAIAAVPRIPGVLCACVCGKALVSLGWAVGTLWQLQCL